MVRFEDAAPRDLRDSMGPAVESGAQDHDLVHALSERIDETVVDVLRAHRNRASGARPVPVDERPRHGGADHGQAREMQRDPEAPLEKQRGERIVEEPRRRGSRRFDSPVKGNERGGSTGVSHRKRFTKRRREDA
jgi:hypothetical protein